jgi:hypothetical protein
MFSFRGTFIPQMREPSGGDALICDYEVLLRGGDAAPIDDFNISPLLRVRGMFRHNQTK